MYSASLLLLIFFVKTAHSETLSYYLLSIFILIFENFATVLIKMPILLMFLLNWLIVKCAMLATNAYVKGQKQVKETCKKTDMYDM